jgi:hypothetical protein
MNGELFLAVAVVLVALAGVAGVVVLSRAVAFIAHAVGGVGAIGEGIVALEHELHKANVLLEAGQGGDTVRTRLTDMEAKIQTSQMVVADAVEKVTSLSSRLQKRVSRAQNERGLLDEGDDGEPVTPQERREALAQLAAAGAGITVDPGTAAAPSKRSGSGWDRVRRTAAGARREA